MIKQRKIAFIVLFSILVSTFSFLNVYALQIGDEIGDVRNTDIKTFINGNRIPSYNINNKSAVMLKDLANYGFDCVYSSQTRSSSVTYNPNKKVTPMTEFDETSGRLGTVAFRYVYTDIVAYVNNKRVESFNVKGYLAIFFADLADYGTFAWNSSARESRFTANVLATGISFNNTTATLKVGDSLTLKATLTPASSTDKDLTWTSANTGIVKVTGNKLEGYLTAVSTGTTTVTATTSSGKTATCTVTVQPVGAAATGITLNKTTATVKIGEYTKLIATVTPSNAADKTVTWSSSNANIARVTQEGDVLGTANGTAVITATTSNGKTATCTITVTPAGVEATGISLNTSSLSLNVNQTVTLTATVTPNNATDKTVTWATSNSSVATVQNGVVKAIAQGTATITATTSNGRTATCNVSVSAGVPATGVTVTAPTTPATVAVGQSIKLTATVSPANATDKTVTWESLNPNIAYVDSAGNVYGIAVGNAMIAVKTSNGYGAFCSVTVVTTGLGIPATAITITPATATVQVGQFLSLTKTLTPANSTDTVMWTSSDSNIAEVNYYTGVVKGISVGSATITAVTLSGKTAQCIVTVTAAGPSIPATAIQLPATANVVRGQFITLIATLTPITSTDTIVWTSSGSAIANVDQYGNVWGYVAEGSVIITATTSSGQRAQCIVTVVSP